MPIWLAALFPAVATAFGSLLVYMTGVVAVVVTYLVSKAGARLLVLLGLVTLFITLFLGVYAVIASQLSGLSAVMPPSFTFFYQFVVPDNFAACASVVMGIKVGVWFWEWKRYFFETAFFGAVD